MKYINLILAALLAMAAGTVAADRGGHRGDHYRGVDRGYHRGAPAVRYVDRGYYRSSPRVYRPGYGHGYWDSFGFWVTTAAVVIGSAVVIDAVVNRSPVVSAPRACYKRQPMNDPSDGQPLYDQNGQPLTQLVSAQCPVQVVRQY
ncbi:MAG: hypothetical protein Q7S04_01230 [Candidatus Moranbacteria bacterium]|nr:hypothetical protein [Candidatus Moranbacteria bacterium]